MHHLPSGFAMGVKISHQPCVYANTMRTELELCTPMGVGVVNRQLQLEAVFTAE